MSVYMLMLFQRSAETYERVFAVPTGSSLEAGRPLSVEGWEDAVKQSGPGEWTSTAAKSIEAVEGQTFEPSMAVVPLPEEWNQSYSLRYVVDRPIAGSGVVLAAYDSASYIQLVEVPQLPAVVFSDVLGGQTTMRDRVAPLAFSPGDRVEVVVEPPSVSLKVNDALYAEVELLSLDEPIWVGFLARQPGFAVSEIELTEV